MNEHLSAAEREALCICAAVGNDERTDTETIALCNAHRCEVDHVMAAHMAQAWDEGATKASEYGGAYLRSYLAENPYRNEADR